MAKESIPVVVRRILAERLMDYNVPGEVISELRDELLAAMERPEKKPFGATVMTEAASLNEKNRPKRV